MAAVALIVAVQKHELLYVQSHEAYKDARQKVLIWQSIGEELGLSGRQ